jgi:hypothetical protein
MRLHVRRRRGVPEKVEPEGSEVRSGEEEEPETRDYSVETRD